MYKIFCNDCDASYVGDAKRVLEVRTDEHKKHSTNANTSFFIHRTANVGYSFDFLDKEFHYYRRLNSEMVHINTQNNGSNMQSDFDELNAT